MPELTYLKTLTDRRGNLSVLEDRDVPFSIKRMFYIYGVDDSDRGGHRHHKTTQMLICITGSCRIRCNNGVEKKDYILDHPKKSLIVYPEDWHIMDQFSKDTVLLVLASHYYDSEDYIFEQY